mmetsp:Transcript_61297/g.142602  ORF Transcript_61297/g.142602 Transcript_61297/m.142602 type:complete len:153 (-) Transcript_61297:396-854(-)
MAPSSSASARARLVLPLILLSSATWLSAMTLSFALIGRRACVLGLIFGSQTDSASADTYAMNLFFVPEGQVGREAAVDKGFSLLIQLLEAKVALATVSGKKNTEVCLSSDEFPKYENFETLQKEFNDRLRNRGLLRWELKWGFGLYCMAVEW